MTNIKNDDYGQVLLRTQKSNSIHILLVGISIFERCFGNINQDV